MTSEKPTWEGASLGTSVTVVRVALGVVLIIGGWKLAFPGDPPGLVTSYTDPGQGWIAPFFVEWITEVLRADVLGFLRTLGALEMLVGLSLVVGLATPWVAGLAGLMFLSFAMANPVAGMVRLAQDVALGGFALAVAFCGSGRWSVDGRLGWLMDADPQRRNWFLGLIRVSLLYAFVMAVTFPFGVGENPLNQTVPWVLVFILAVALLFPRMARICCGAIAVWMIALVLVSVGQTVMEQGVSGLYWGLDSAKRQVGFLGAATAYLLSGPDQVTLLSTWTRRRGKPPRRRS